MSHRHPHQANLDDHPPSTDPPRPLTREGAKCPHDLENPVQALKTPQEAYLEEELDKIIGVRDERELISPFTDEILRAKFPLKFTRPLVAHYNETTDPKVFLSHFRYVMINQDLTPIHMCKLFPEYLTRNANEWFN